MRFPGYDRMLLLADGVLDTRAGKTAHGMLRYCNRQCVAVLDRTWAGRTCGEVIGMGGNVPIVATVAEAMRYNPASLVIGLAIEGGRIPPKYRSVLKQAIQNRLHILNGLHMFLKDDPDLAALAKRHQVQLVDLRYFPDNYKVSRGLWATRKSKVILAVGTECACGKMSALLEVYAACKTLGKSCAYIGTGQTGMLIAGRGFPADAIKSDFVAGTMEYEIMKLDGRYEYIFVEGQGALTHQGYSAVTLGLLHGCMPDALLLCHQLHRKLDDYQRPMIAVEKAMTLHEQVLAHFRKTHIFGIGANTAGFSEKQAQAGMQALERRTRRPADDTVRFGGDKLAKALVACLK